MKKLLSAFFILTSLSLHSQTVGYLGKCNYVTLKSSFSSYPFFANNLFSGNYWGRWIDSYAWFTPEVEYNRVITTNSALGLSASLINEVLYKTSNSYTDTYQPCNVYGTFFRLNYSIYAFKKK